MGALLICTAMFNLKVERFYSATQRFSENLWYTAVQMGARALVLDSFPAYAGHPLPIRRSASLQQDSARCVCKQLGACRFVEFLRPKSPNPESLKASKAHHGATASRLW